MTTDNRTNEQIVAEAICGRRYRSGTPGYLASTDNPTDYGDARSVLTALEAAGRVPVQGEPNGDREAVIRRALEHVREVRENGLAGPYVHDLPKDVGSNWGWLQTMWPVVVAVDIALASRATAPDDSRADQAYRDGYATGKMHAGTAPHAESEPLREALKTAREHFTAIAGSGEIQAWEDTGEKRGIDYQASVWAKRGERVCREALAAPVLPSSTVDEDELAKVIHRAACGPECTDDAPMRMDYRIARAVVEAIGGEGR